MTQPQYVSLNILFNPETGELQMQGPGNNMLALFILNGAMKATIEGIVKSQQMKVEVASGVALNRLDGLRNGSTS